MTTSSFDIDLGKLGCRWTLSDGVLDIRAPIRRDPFDHSQDSTMLAVRGTGALLFDWTTAYSAVIEELGTSLGSNPHGLLVYNFSDSEPADVFIVPARWDVCPAVTAALPGLLEMTQHRHRVIEIGAELLTRCLGKDATRQLYDLAYGSNLESFVSITALEYGAHSYSHCVSNPFISSNSIRRLSGYFARAAEEHRADQLASCLLDHVYGRDVALSAAAAQLITRITCDLFSDSEGTESRAHHEAAMYSLDECSLSVGNSSRRDMLATKDNRDWSTVLAAVIDRRIENVRALLLPTS